MDQHYNKHVIQQGEFGNITKEQYLEGAKNLPNVSDYSGIRSNGDALYYNSATNEFGIITPDNVIKTYFKPTRGLEYYLQEVGK